MKTISFIIPLYNEELRLKKTIKALTELQLPRGLDLTEVIFVNDGSLDRTENKVKAVMNTLQKQLGTKVLLLSYDENHGKGYAIRHGMQVTTADYALFFDADMSTPLTELKKFMPLMKEKVDVIVGTRKNGQSTVIVHQPRSREILGKGFTIMTQLLLGVVATDFTCGFKAFSKRARAKVFSKAFINRWGYDAELLYLASHAGFPPHEVAVLWSDDARSKVNLRKDIPRTLWDLTSIVLMHKMHFIEVKYIAIELKALYTSLTPISPLRINISK